MKFNSSEKDLIQNYWIDISQDPDFISQDTGIDKTTVLDILQNLKQEGKIQNFNYDEFLKVKKFTEFFSYK
jgi:hypothetical protein